MKVLFFVPRFSHILTLKNAIIHLATQGIEVTIASYKWKKSDDISWINECLAKKLQIALKTPPVDYDEWLSFENWAKNESGNFGNIKGKIVDSFPLSMQMVGFIMADKPDLVCFSSFPNQPLGPVRTVGLLNELHIPNLLIQTHWNSIREDGISAQLGHSGAIVWSEPLSKRMTLKNGVKPKNVVVLPPPAQKFDPPAQTDTPLNPIGPRAHLGIPADQKIIYFSHIHDPEATNETIFETERKTLDLLLDSIDWKGISNTAFVFQLDLKEMNQRDLGMNSNIYSYPAQPVTGLFSQQIHQNIIRESSAVVTGSIDVGMESASHGIPWIDLFPKTTLSKYLPEWTKRHYIAATTIKKVDTLIKDTLSNHTRQHNQINNLSTTSIAEWSEDLCDAILRFSKIKKSSPNILNQRYLLRALSRLLVRKFPAPGTQLQPSPPPLNSFGATVLPLTEPSSSSGPPYNPENLAPEDLDAYMRYIASNDAPILAGPWFSEVGFEILYWTPFLRKLLTSHDIDPKRVIVASRGGTGAWYDGLFGHYLDLFDYIDQETFQKETLKRFEDQKGQKHMGITPFDTLILEKAKQITKNNVINWIHPNLMYRLFRHYWQRRIPPIRFDEYTKFSKLNKPDPGDIAKHLPERYMAIRFYFRPSLPNTEEVRQSISQLIDNLSADRDVVILDTGLSLDDHEEFLPTSVRKSIVRTGHLITPRNNLDVQTRIIANADLFIGTYGGLSYVPPIFGVPSIGLSSDIKGFSSIHLETAERAFHKLNVDFNHMRLGTFAQALKSRNHK
jgi:hypothetical protein